MAAYSYNDKLCKKYEEESLKENEPNANSKRVYDALVKKTISFKQSRARKSEVYTMATGMSLNVNYVDKDRKTTLLREAMYRRADDLIEYLLEKGANPNFTCGEQPLPLIFAIQLGSTSLVEMLLGKGNGENSKKIPAEVTADTKSNAKSYLEKASSKTKVATIDADKAQKKFDSIIDKFVKSGKIKAGPLRHNTMEYVENYLKLNLQKNEDVQEQKLLKDAKTETAERLSEMHAALRKKNAASAIDKMIDDALNGVATTAPSEVRKVEEHEKITYESIVRRYVNYYRDMGGNELIVNPTSLMREILSSDRPNYKELEVILDHGAKPNAELSFWPVLTGENRPNDYIPAIWFAFSRIREKDESLVILLLERGANPNIKSGWTALLVSSLYYGYFRVFYKLLEKGADPDIQSDQNGSTALHFILDSYKKLSMDPKSFGGVSQKINAKKEELKRAANKLLDKGASIDIKNNDGVTVREMLGEFPFYIARFGQKTEIYRLFEPYMDKSSQASSSLMSSSKIDSQMKSILYACKVGDEATVKALLQQTPILQKTKTSTGKSLEEFAKYHNQRHLLHLFSSK